MTMKVVLGVAVRTVHGSKFRDAIMYTCTASDCSVSACVESGIQHDDTPVLIIHILVCIPQHVLQVMHVWVQNHTQAIKYEWISNALHLIGPTTQMGTKQENCAT
jgi:hypothetical protein